MTVAQSVPVAAADTTALGDPGLRIAVVIVTYNSAGHVGPAISSLAAATNQVTEIVVVDNASNDDSVGVVARTCPSARIIRSETNLGFAAACNLGAAATDAQILLFLNPDAELDPGCIDKGLSRLLTDPTVGIIGGRTRYADGTLNATCCFREPTLWSAFCYASGLASLFRHSDLFNPEAMGGWDRGGDRTVDVVTGCFALIRRDLFRRLGGFDERFFIYSEDTDLSLRVRDQGLRCVHLGDVGLVHVGGGSDVVPAAKLTKVFRGRCQYYALHWSPAAARLGVLALDVAVLSRLAITAVVGPRDRREKWRDVWRARTLWHDPTIASTRLVGHREIPNRRNSEDNMAQIGTSTTTDVVTPVVRHQPHPAETRARIAYQITCHVARSAVRRDFDFVGQGLASAVRLPGLVLADVTLPARRECNVCGWSGRAFYPNTGAGFHERAVTCPGCSSLDRHRSLLALLLTETEIFSQEQRVVEVAPMRGFEALMKAQPRMQYTSFDIERHAMEHGDITAMRYATDSVDCFVCFHVLEHLPDD
ncbi:MAG: glycosyltransferase, partial [Dermatophilaceae bacterium]